MSSMGKEAKNINKIIENWQMRGDGGGGEGERIKRRRAPTMDFP